MADDPYLVWKREGKKRGTHALVVGVSDYAKLKPVNEAGGPGSLGLKKLRCAALSAWRFEQWLIRNADELGQPLASVRSLLAPSVEEIAAEPKLPTNRPRPTLEEFAKAATAWRAAAMNNDDVTILYFAGHGLQSESGNQLLVFDDFGDDFGNPFAKTARLQNIIDGMAPSKQAPLVAQMQYYFVDTCRNTPDEMKEGTVEPGTVFRVLNKRDERSLAIFNATTFGKQAEGLAGVSTNFGDALLKALEISSDRTEGAGPDKRWIVTPDMLKDGILLELARAGHPPEAPVTFSGTAKMVLRRLPKPPDVSVRIMLAPDACIPATTVEITDLGSQPLHSFPKDGVAHPYSTTVPMGIYLLSAQAPAPFTSLQKVPAVITFRDQDWPLSLS
jgi:hypothetical protein